MTRRPDLGLILVVRSNELYRNSRIRGLYDTRYGLETRLQLPVYGTFCEKKGAKAFVLSRHFVVTGGSARRCLFAIGAGAKVDLSAPPLIQTLFMSMRPRLRSSPFAPHHLPSPVAIGRQI